MLIVAHRGYSAAYPENSALAFERAIEVGADFIETDVRVARDGALVCSHDPDLRRVAGDPRPIDQLARTDIEAIELARGQRVPTLEQVLVLAQGRTQVMLDVKVTTAAMAEAITDCLARTAMTEHVVYGARTVEHLRCIADRCPGVAILGMPKAPEFAPAFLAHAVRAIRFWEDEVTPERIALVHAAGREVWVTAGLRPRQEAPGYVTPARAEMLSRRGVDALLVNDPTCVHTSHAPHRARGRMGSASPADAAGAPSRTIEGTAGPNGS
jgi:glycerophosphoryl diester phosphodiesterase